jgi:hypothetical protein
MDMELTTATMTLASLSDKIRLDRGLLDDWGGPVSYNSVNHQFRRLSDALDEGWIDEEDGTYCDRRWVIHRLLMASVPKKYRSTITATAIDWTAIETWGTFLGSVGSMDDDGVLTAAIKEMGAAYVDVDETVGSRLSEALAAESSTRAGEESSTLTGDADHHEDGKVAHHGTHGKVSKTAPKRKATSIKGPDGRPIYTTDIDARGGYRTATAMQKGREFIGFDLHLATAVRSFQWSGDVTKGVLGEYVPPFILGSLLQPARSDDAAAAVSLLDDLVASLPLAEAITDRGYTYLKPHTFHWKLRAMGLALVMDFTKAQRRSVKPVIVKPRRGSRPPTMLYSNCGTLLHSWTPESLRQLGPIPKDIANREAVHLEYERRADYRWSISDGQDGNGDVRLRCPFCAGRLRTDLPVSTTVSKLRTWVPVPEGQTACCCGKVTASPAALGPWWQPVPYGTRAWAQSYGRRAVAETSNSLLKAGFARMRRGFVKIMGTAKTDLMVGLTCVAVNLSLADAIAHTDPPKARAKRRGGGRRRVERTLAQLAKREGTDPDGPSSDPPGADPPGDPPGDPPVETPDAVPAAA